MKNRDFYIDNNSDEAIEGRGKNIILPPKEKSLWAGYVEKFKDPLIIVLLVVFVLSMCVALYEIVFAGKDWSTIIEPLGVLAALLLATGVGFIFEVKAEREFKILNTKKDERPVKVLRWMRNSKRPQMLEIKRSDVVVGDVVSLESGDEVPADGTLFETESLMVDESAFTGEMYANKSLDSDDNEGAYPADFLLRGSTVIGGHCLYKVTAIGMDTEEGKGAKIIQEEDNVKTPLNKQLDSLGRWITLGSYIIAAFIVVGRLLYYFFFDGNAANNSDILDIVTFTLNSVMIAVTLIVVAVPEGLPMSVTISLALSMRNMLRENNLVRKLHACETMGAATVVCTDKTGTLTMNELHVVEESVECYTDADILARSIAVNSTAELCDGDSARKVIGNPTEGALLTWLKEKKGIDYQDLRDEVTVLGQDVFSSETKQMSTYVQDKVSGRKLLYVKGAPEIILQRSDVVAGDHSREEIVARLQELQRRGQRTLAFSVKEMDDGEDKPMVFIGFIGMMDPVRSDVRDAIDTCHNAGVNVIMVTGDTALTANEIASQSGITDEKEFGSITGTEFAEMGDEELKRDILPHLKVMSRARPSDKARLVTLLQERGEVVAVTGDGTNDAPALKKAHVGLSMGDGTARAKEASDITIIDNSFSSINKAILWGRSLYLNIRRFIIFQMTVNICACLIVLLGAFTGLDSPLNVTQMLWVNLIMDTFAAMALSSLPADERVTRDKPRHPNSQIIDRFMALRIVLTGTMFFFILFGMWQLLWHCSISQVSDLFDREVWHIYFSNFLDFSSHKAHLNGYELGLFFTFFVLMQFWNIFNARYFRTGRTLAQDIVRSLRDHNWFHKAFSRGFLLIVSVILLGQVLIVNLFGEAFGVSPLSFADWAWMLLITSPILLVGEVVRCLRILSRRRA
jgi:Ca2+-transporting ATPase